VTDYNVVSTLFDPWNGDKLLHGGFTYGLVRGTLTAMHGASDVLYTAATYTDNETVTAYLEQTAATVDDPSFVHATLCAAGTVAVFSVTKEWHDAYVDYLDVVANSVGGSAALYDEYRRNHTDSDDTADADVGSDAATFYDELVDTEEELE